MLERVDALLYQKGYRPLDPKSGGVLIRETEQVVYVLALSTFRPEYDAAAYENAANRILFTVATRYQKKVELLNLVATESGMFSDDAMQFVEKLHDVWLITQDTGRIYIFENQPSEFDGLYEYIDISGSKILGMIAGKLKEKYQELISGENELIISNGYIMNGEKRCVPAAASLQKEKDQSYDDEGKLLLKDMLLAK